MNILKAFDVAFQRKEEKKWEKIYVLVDIHDTLLHATYGGVETYHFFPHSRRVLRLLSSRDDVCLILWSSCYAENLQRYMLRFKEEGIHFNYVNENPEVSNTRFQDFSTKLYFNVGLDDKFGFEPETDWKLLAVYFKR